MITEIFNTWEEEWNRVQDNAYDLTKLHRVGNSIEWVYFIEAWEKGITIIRIDRKTILKIDSGDPLSTQFHGKVKV